MNKHGQLAVKWPVRVVQCWTACHVPEMVTDLRGVLARDVTTGKWSRLFLMKVPIS
jgi:hypothetical protein